MNKVNTVTIGGWQHVKLTNIEFAELMLYDCRHKVTNSKPKLAFSMNGQALSLTRTDKRFREAMSHADYIQADGQSLVIASKILEKNPLPERIATTDFFHYAAAIAEREQLRFYFLGGNEDTINSAVTNIKNKYPRLIISGYRNGYFKKSDYLDICHEISSSKTDVLWVGLGKPKEQIFCVDNLDHLQEVPWIKSCGGLFDFLAEKNSRAPKWMQTFGLEWLYRVILEPRRLFWRYFSTNIHALFIIISDKICRLVRK